MEPELILTFTILAVTTVFFMIGNIRTDLVALLSLLTLVLTGIISTQDALNGFSNSVVIMIAGLFIVGGGIFRTGLASQAGQILMKASKNSELRLLILLMIIVGVLSGFMSNTGTVAVLLPVVVSLAMSMKKSPAKFLIPLAFASSLGGVLTLIGTPPNLIVSQMLADYGYERLSFFDFTPLGLVAFITGIIFLVFFGPFLLPKDSQFNRERRDGTISVTEMAKNYQITDKLYTVRVLQGCPMANQKLADIRLPANYQLCVLKIQRKSKEGTKILPVTYHEMAGPKSIIHEQDILYLQGAQENIEKLCKDYGLKLTTESSTDAEKLVSRELGIAEVLLTPHSRLINSTIQKLSFREKYNLNIIGINRKGQYVLDNMSNVKLRFGDALLVQGAWPDIELLAKETQDVVVVGQPQEQASMAAASGKAPIAGAIMLMMLILMTFEIVPAVTAVIIAAVLMVITGCLRNMDDAYGRINWESVILIAAMLPMATALENTGGVQFLADGLVSVLGGYGPLAVLAGFYLATMFFSQFISNTATAVLFAPIAVTAAVNMGVSPYPLLLSVSIAASMAFATPVASPTNALVMTAGGYKFSDFVKIGVPLQLLLFIVMLFAIPFFFPF
ncbi:SLC13 family permease [Alkalihalobacterium chitinilyticum]|uniref:SLC13 family permease n=1 Tax=Alkalihalobacterium chitinilyticum TaxID=2980103 RepID=A0ABT5V8S2_9BACI|nr:SLC13 family permease [Alkalihalobacterium chitinilyticum]MDE5411858.1 SLC13 family permease [Alkalihalobacterium chitinilyticum]